MKMMEASDASDRIYSQNNEEAICHSRVVITG